MSETSNTGSSSPFSMKAIGLMLVIAILSFGAVIVLLGWSPELKDKNKAGDHPFSTSAIGYNGFVQLLESLDYPVEISRLERNLSTRDWGLMVVTTSPYGMRRKLKDMDFAETTLIVLPKWTGRTDWSKPKRQIDTKFVRARQINDLLSDIEIDAELGRVTAPKILDSPFGKVSPKPDMVMQVLQSETLEPIIEAEGGALLAKVPGEEVYILADPDMMNTFGLATLENAEFSIGLIDWLRYDSDEPIFLDATLHGFARSANLLQMAFDIPFVGATIAALASAFLLGWAAMIRFGPPAREERVIALGKQALADNSAGLVSMARREVQMAPGYLSLIRKRVAKEISAPRSLSDEQLTALFDRLGPETVSGKTYSQMEAGLKAPAADRADLMNKARELYRWRQDIIGRSTNERK